MSEKVIICPICGQSDYEELSASKYKCRYCETPFSVDIEEITLDLREAHNAHKLYNFSQALDLYSSICKHSDDEEVKAMCYYGSLLSAFGVNFIKDKQGNVITSLANYHKDIISIKDTDYYKKLMKLSNYISNEQKHKINEIVKEYERLQKELSEKAEYDIFICCKVTPFDAKSENEKTKDNNVALDLYEKLSVNHNVFYSEVDLAGSIHYDSQIYSALMRSRIILVISSSREYLESPWVQSEWRRWLNFISEGKKENNSLFFYKIENFLSPDAINRTNVFISEKKLIDDIDAYLLNLKDKEIRARINSARTNLNLAKYDAAYEILNELTIDYRNDYRVWIELVEWLRYREIEEEDVRYKQFLYKAIECADPRTKEDLKYKYKKFFEEKPKKLNLEVELQRAHSFVARHNFAKAEELYNNLAELYFADYRIWLGLLELLDVKKECDCNDKYCSYVTEAIRLCNDQDEIEKIKVKYNRYLDKSIRKFFITYDLNGANEEFDIQEAYYNKRFELKIPVREGYKFINYIYNNKVIFSGVYRYNDDIVVKAIWEEEVKESAKYNISYVLDGAVNPINNPHSYHEGENHLLFAANKKGYKFEGWFKDANYSESIVSINNQMSGDLTLYPKFSPKEYSIYYNANGGNIQIEKQRVLYGNPIKLTIPYKEGYTFKGYYLDGDRFTDDVYQFDHDIVLVAQWGQGFYSINYHLNKGYNSTKNPSVFCEGVDVTLYPAKKLGYDFDGWYDNPTFRGKPLEVLKDVNYDVDLYAKYKPFERTITLISDNKIYQEIKVLYDGEIQLPTPVKSGSKFSGWYENGELFTETIWKKTINIELVAKWESNIKFDANNPKWGKYPQTLVTDNSLITKLNNLNTINNDGYYELDGKEYAKVTVEKLFKNDFYQFSNGEKVNVAKTYYFVVEPIEWIVVKKNNTEYNLLSKLIIDNRVFAENGDNKYSSSDIRKWLISDFYQTAFSASEQELMKNLTEDKLNDAVYLLSQNDAEKLKNESYFKCLSSDYALARGCMLQGGFANWLLRSPGFATNQVCFVSNSGLIMDFHAVTHNYKGTRVGITVKIK